MAQAIAHRGPDATGFYEGDGVYFAHKRLSIIDLASGSQPMWTRDGTRVVVFNGEIFNFQAIREELAALGCTFETSSDTEVLLAAYSIWGERCLDKFIGFFAFAIHDRAQKLVFLARDRLGIKPLYYWQTAGRLVFASEVKALLASGLAGGTSVEPEAIDSYVTLGYVPGPQTLFEGVRKLEPGHYAVWRDGSLEIRPYWSLQGLKPFTGSFEEASERFRELLTDSVRLRLISDVPVGVFLSGGLDSASIVATICGELNRGISTYSVGYSDHPEISELANARLIARRYGTEHHELVLTHGDFFDALDKLLHFVEEPLVEPAAIALLQLSAFARRHVTVLLSGEGGDEVLAGYPLYQIMPRTERLRSGLPRAVLSLAQRAARTEKQKKYLDWLAMPLAEKYMGISCDVTPNVKRGMYHAEFARRHAGRIEQRYRRLFEECDGGTDLRRMQYVDIKTWLPDDLLLKADKMTMAASVELRVPFLDHRLVELGYSLPDDFKIRDGERKYLLKKLMEPKLPAEIVYQKKKGFPVPVAAWFRGVLYDRVAEVLLDPHSLARGYFNPEYVRRVLQRHRSGAEDLSRRIMTLLVLELWHRKHIDRGVAPSARSPASSTGATNRARAG
jgi:asparagine synthase (glutamine-hydrolysing)